MRKVGTLDEVARRLYARAPEDFTAARDEAARDARDAGDRALASEIAKLRRPTQAAWLANLLALRRGGDVAAWLALGDEMRDAHHQLSGSRLRELSTRRTELVGELLAAARELAAEAGRQPTDSTVTELRATLQAALADAEVAEALRAGRLQRAATSSGLGFTPGFEAAGEPGTGVPTAPTAPAAPGGETAASRPRLRLVEPKARRGSQAAAEQVARARDGVATAEQAVEAAAVAEQEARAAYDEFGARLAELREEISELEEHRAEADRARRRHTRERERAERELARAHRRLDRVATDE